MLLTDTKVFVEIREFNFFYLFFFLASKKGKIAPISLTVQRNPSEIDMGRKKRIADIVINVGYSTHWQQVPSALRLVPCYCTPPRDVHLIAI